MTALFKTSGNVPFLEHDQERSLLRSWQEEGNRKALEQLIFSHDRLVRRWAAKYCKDLQIREELVTEGYIGLVKAANEFDLDRNVRFSTYARWWVRNHIAKANAELTSFFGLAAGKSSAGFLTVNLDNELLEGLKCDDPDPEETLVQLSARNTLLKKVVAALVTLNLESREIVVARHLKYQAESIDQLAARLSISPERVRLIERRALSQLKYQMIQSGVMTSRNVER